MNNSLRAFFSRLRAFFSKASLDRDFGDELAAHIELLTEENIRSGMPPEEARRAALIKLGGVEPARELHRDTRSLPFLDSLLQDLRYTFRTLRRDIGFTTFAILIVGLGIGASATVFSVVTFLPHVVLFGFFLREGFDRAEHSHRPPVLLDDELHAFYARAGQQQSEVARRVRDRHMDYILRRDQTVFHQR